MVIYWKTNIPKSIYARLYCSWSRVKREVEILSSIFTKYSVKKIVEFGCGLGRHGYLLSRMGFEVLLTDAIDWRYGVARKLPFSKLDVLEDNNSINNVFDAGYGVNLLTIFNYNDIVKVLENMGKLVGKGLLVFDYNFKLYSEPRVKIIRLNNRVFRVVLEEERVESNENASIYNYRIKVFNQSGRVIGFEEGSYIVYDKTTLIRAVEEAGYRLVDIVWTKWDPVHYLYHVVNNESDSAFLVLKKNN